MNRQSRVLESVAYWSVIIYFTVSQISFPNTLHITLLAKLFQNLNQSILKRNTHEGYRLRHVVSARLAVKFGETRNQSETPVRELRIKLPYATKFVNKLIASHSQPQLYTSHNLYTSLKPTRYLLPISFSHILHSCHLIHFTRWSVRSLFPDSYERIQSEDRPGPTFASKAQNKSFSFCGSCAMLFRALYIDRNSTPNLLI